MGTIPLALPKGMENRLFNELKRRGGVVSGTVLMDDLEIDQTISIRIINSATWIGPAQVVFDVRFTYQRIGELTTGQLKLDLRETIRSAELTAS